MEEFIRGIDMKGKNFQFSINDGSYQTVMGGVVTILYGLAFISLLLWYGRDIVLRQQPTLLTTDTMFDDYQQITLFPSNFTFALRVEDINGELINDPSLFYYEFFYDYYTIENGVNTLQIEIQRDLRPCSLKHVDNKTLVTYSLQNYMCTDSNYSIGGNWGGSFMHNPYFLIRRCNEQTESKYKVKCKTDDEVVKQYDSLIIDTYTQINLVNSGNYDLPVSKTMVYNFQGLNLDNTKAIKKRIIYRSADINSDIGFLFSTENRTSFIEYETTETDISPWEKSFGAYALSVNFELSRNFRRYDRVYRKISDALADVGGIMSLIIMVVDFLFNFYLDISYWNFLQVKLFRLYKEVVRDGTQSQSKIDLTSSAIKIQKDFHNNDNNDASSSDVSLAHSLGKKLNKKKGLYKLILDNKKPKCLNKDIDKLLSKSNRKLEEVKISVCFRFKATYFYSQSRKEAVNMNETELKLKIMKACEVELNRKTDIFNLLKTLDQFKLVKKTLFNENQCFMLSKMDLTKIIDTDVKDRLELSDINQKRNEVRFSNLVLYLRENSQSNSLSPIDVLLMNNLEPVFRDEITKETAHIS